MQCLCASVLKLIATDVCQERTDINKKTKARKTCALDTKQMLTEISNTFLNLHSEAYICEPYIIQENRTLHDSECDDCTHFAKN